MFLQSIIDFDYRVFKFLNSLAGVSPTRDKIFIALSEYVLYILIAGLALYVLSGWRNKQAGGQNAKHISVGAVERQKTVIQAIAAAFVGRALIATLIRLFFFRARPFVIGQVMQLVPHNPLEGSFPSGHATIMFALAFALLAKNRAQKAAVENIPKNAAGEKAGAKISAHEKTCETAWGIVYLLLATLSGLSRVVVGVHFPLDIIGGAATAGVSVFIVNKITNAISARMTLKKNGV